MGEFFNPNSKYLNIFDDVNVYAIHLWNGKWIGNRTIFSLLKDLYISNPFQDNIQDNVNNTNE